MRFLSLLLVSATPAIADIEGYNNMMGWGYGHGFGLMFGPVLWLVVLGLIVAGVIWFVRHLDSGSAPHRQSDALVELDMRFARGEIDAEDYAARKKLLKS